MITKEIPQLPDREPGLFDPDYATLPEDETSVNRYFQLQDLRESLNHLSSMDASGMPSPANAYSTAGYDPENAPEARRSKQQAEHDLAFAYFARAYLGDKALEATGVYEPNSPEYKKSWTGFHYFKRMYGSPRNESDRTEYWKQLMNQIAVIEGKEVPYEFKRPIPGIKPSSDEYPETLGEGKEKEDTLTTHDKVLVLSERDKRAGFYPRTQRQSTAAAGLLNYLEETIVNPVTGRKIEIPIRVDNQLHEIYKHQVNTHNAKYANEKAAAVTSGKVWIGPSNEEIGAKSREIAEDSVRSVVNEWDDYRADAKKSKKALLDLKEFVMNHGTPHTKLIDLLQFPEAENIDPIPFIRYVILRAFAETGELPSSFNPMLTREIRPAPEGSPDHKNKVVTDIFQFAPDYEKVAGEVEAMERAIDKRTILELIDPSIIDSDNLHKFFNHALVHITGKYAEYARRPSRTNKAA